MVIKKKVLSVSYSLLYGRTLFLSLPFSPFPPSDSLTPFPPSTLETHNPPASVSEYWAYRHLLLCLVHLFIHHGLWLIFALWAVIIAHLIFLVDFTSYFSVFKLAPVCPFALGPYHLESASASSHGKPQACLHPLPFFPRTSHFSNEGSTTFSEWWFLETNIEQQVCSLKYYLCL